MKKIIKLIFFSDGNYKYQSMNEHGTLIDPESQTNEQVNPYIK